MHASSLSARCTAANHLCSRTLTLNLTSNPEQVRLTRVPLPESKGPCYARYVGAQQYRGETFYMQLDSHMTLVPRWCGPSQVPPKVSALRPQPLYSV